jgi:hypothetical protein
MALPLSPRGLTLTPFDKTDAVAQVIEAVIGHGAKPAMCRAWMPITSFVLLPFSAAPC